MNSLIAVYTKLNITPLLTALLAYAVFYFVFVRRDPYADIPAIGSTNFLLSYIDVVRYIIRGPQTLQEGYEKFNKTVGVFRIPSMSGWHVFVCGAQQLEEIKSLENESELSAQVANKILISGEYTLGQQIFDNPYHIRIAHTKLTNNLDAWFEPLKTGIVATFENSLPLTTDWTSVKLHQISIQVAARAINFIIISDPNIYQDPNYLTSVTGFTLDTALAPSLLGLFPKALKPLARRFLLNNSRDVSFATEALRTTVESRTEKIAEHGDDYPGKSNDLLSFLMDEGQGEERTIESLARRVLLFNLAAIQSTAMTLSLILRDLADRPEYIKPLREEAESVTSKYGFTIASLAHLRKLDSFIMESQRVMAPRAITSNRWTVNDYTFSNGVRVPKNTMIAVPMRARHYDDTLFDNPYKFDGLRFYQNESDGDNNSATRGLFLTSADSPFMLFGMGKHICPGRFLVTTMFKIAITHFLLNYDAKLDPANFPRNSWIGPDLLPNDSASLLIRGRKKDSEVSADG